MERTSAAAQPDPNKPLVVTSRPMLGSDYSTSPTPEVWMLWGNVVYEYRYRYGYGYVWSAICYLSFTVKQM